MYSQDADVGKKRKSNDKKQMFYIKASIPFVATYVNEQNSKLGFDELIINHIVLQSLTLLYFHHEKSNCI